jgi:GNAT superfamily N-acetyltransferase
VLVTPVPWDDPDAVALRAAQRAEIEARYGPDSEPGVAPSAADIAHFVVAYSRDSRPVGCGGLRQLDPHCGELKRMYVVPGARGTGVADAVLAALETYARSVGWTRLRLETGLAQPEAVRFYTRSGYRPIPGFGPYAGKPSSLCFERVLT